MVLKNNPFLRLCHHYKDGNLEWAVCEVVGQFSEISSICENKSFVEYALTHFSNEKRRCQWLASRMMVRELLGTEVCVVNDANGKPRLCGDNRNISISHTDGYVAVALCSGGDVGIDIEHRGTKVFKVRRRFMNVCEEARLDVSDEQTALLLHWSAKESFYKIIGNRGGSYAANFIIEPFAVGDKGEFRISYINGGETIKESTVSYLVECNYVFTLCVDAR